MKYNTETTTTATNMSVRCTAAPSRGAHLTASKREKRERERAKNALQPNEIFVCCISRQATPLKPLSGQCLFILMFREFFARQCPTEMSKPSTAGPGYGYGLSRAMIYDDDVRRECRSRRRRGRQNPCSIPASRPAGQYRSRSMALPVSSSSK